MHLKHTRLSENINELVGVFTTANARVILYELFESVGLDNVIYADTDSVIYIETDENEYFYKNCNSALGDYDCELKKTKDKNRRYIKEFVGLGSKTYAYKTATDTTVVKSKGITMDVENQKLFDYDNMKAIIKDEIKTIKSKKRFTFKSDRNMNVRTEYIQRSIKPTYTNKRYVHTAHNNMIDTLPYGFEDGEG